MKTLPEKILHTRDMLDKLTDLVNTVRGQQAFLNQIDLLDQELGIETQVHYDAPTIWRFELAFLQSAIIYHFENYTKAAEAMLCRLECMSSNGFLQEDTTVPMGNAADNMSYEFDSLMIKFFQLLEDPMIVDLRKVMKNNKAKDALDFIESKRSRRDAGSLFWRINLFRVQAAHSLDARYQEKDGNAARYKGISSQATLLHVKSDTLSLPCLTLIDLKENPKARSIIQAKIIEGGSKDSLLDILFQASKSPSGHSKKRPVALMPWGFNSFDLLNSFYELALEMVEYIKSINRLFYENCKTNKSDTMRLTYGQDAGGSDLVATKELFIKGD